jgi:hypothetical protein
LILYLLKLLGRLRSRTSSFLKYFFDSTCFSSRISSTLRWNIGIFRLLKIWIIKSLNLVVLIYVIVDLLMLLGWIEIIIAIIVDIIYVSIIDSILAETALRSWSPLVVIISSWRQLIIAVCLKHIPSIAIILVVFITSSSNYSALRLLS